LLIEERTMTAFIGRAIGSKSMGDDFLVHVGAIS